MTDAKTGWTPGPWDIAWGDPITIHDFAEIQIANDGSHTANAHLVAAAPCLYEALKVTNKLVSEAAMTGFNHKDGDWAERLFENQAVISNALRKARGEQS